MPSWFEALLQEVGPIENAVAAGVHLIQGIASAASAGHNISEIGPHAEAAAKAILANTQAPQPEAA
jgi:hypothetical protein